MVFLIAVLVFALIYLRLNKRLNFWRRKNVPFVSASVHSSVIALFYNPISLFDHYANIYAQLKGHKYGGSFWLFQPQFVVRDPDLIKHFLTKDFEHFRDRGNTNFDEHDSLTNHLFSAPGELWKALRVRLTPTFSSGKMKFMFGTVKECAEEYQHMLEKPANRGVLLNFKDVSVGYTIEVINSTAFGWKSNTINDTNNEFRNVSRAIFRLGIRFKIRRIIKNYLPFLKPYVTIHLLPQWIRNFFFDTVRETVEYRKKTGYTRNDFLQLLMTLNESTERETHKHNHSQYELRFTNELMTAQCFLFFVAGFDTSSLILSMTLLELAVNEEIQKKLQDEMDSLVGENEDNITYELIKSMPYLQKVIQETLRKYPVLPFLSRICTKTYNVPDTDIIIEKGTEVIIPIAGMHRDAEIYPNSEVYDPDRFNPEEIQKRHNYVYLPFGEGPRNCIGSRFGLMTVKLGVVHILKKFNLQRTPNTVYPMRFLPNKLITDCGCPVLLQCSPRS